MNLDYATFYDLTRTLRFRDAELKRAREATAALDKREKDTREENEQLKAIRKQLLAELA